MTHPPLWLQDLIEQVTETVTPLAQPAELACHYFHSTSGDDEWEVTLFPETPQFGGRLTGYHTADALSVDVFALVQVFDLVSNCRWQTQVVASDDEIGPHLSVEGEYEGNNVWLRVASNPPSRLLKETHCDRNTQRVE